MKPTVRCRMILLAAVLAILSSCKPNPDGISAPPVNVDGILDEELIAPVMPDIDYASSERIIFHGFFGLFVVNPQTMDIEASLNLSEINCEYQQGDMATMVRVKNDGKIVYLVNYYHGFTYVYDVTRNELLKENLFEPKEQDLYKRKMMEADYFSIEPLGWKSDSIAYINEDEFAQMFVSHEDVPGHSMPRIRELSILMSNIKTGEYSVYCVFG